MTNPWWLLSAGAGIASAVVFMTTPPGPMTAIVLTILAIVPLFMAGLGLGSTAGAVAAAVSIGCVLLFRGPMGGTIFAGGFAIPAAILIRQAMLSREDEGVTEWYPAGLLAATLTIVGLALSAGITSVISSLAVQEMFDERLQAIAENFAASTEGAITADELMRRMEPAKRLLPGFMTGFQMLVLLGGAALAQAALVRLERNLRPWPDFAGMELPNWTVVLAAATVAGALVLPDPAGTYALAAAFAASFAFLLQGLALVHAFNRKIQGGTILLVIFYLLVFAPVWPAMLVVLLGAVEQFAGFRRRWGNETES